VNKRWIKEHCADFYVQQSQKDGYSSRAAYKLLEINQKERLLARGMTVIDLGAAPGGWSQVAYKLVGPHGKVIAVDLLPLEITLPITFIQGNFCEQGILDHVLESAKENKVRVVLSDMAPNLSGHKDIDQPRSLYLAELAFDCAQQILQPGGHFLVKVFQGAGCESFSRCLKSQFSTVKLLKPKASRPSSREFYLLGKGFLGYTH